MTSKTRRVGAIDQYIAERVKKARLEKGYTQEYVANNLGITFQQLQKYEHGANRISAGRLAYISGVLGKPITWFYPGLYRDAEAQRAINEVERMQDRIDMALGGIEDSAKKARMMLKPKGRKSKK